MTCGRYRCTGCAGCDPDGSPPGADENDLQRMQRRKREEDALRAAGKPTMRVRLGDAARRKEGP
jgi:hypothetical protein